MSLVGVGMERKGLRNVFYFKNNILYKKGFVKPKTKGGFRIKNRSWSESGHEAPRHHPSPSSNVKNMYVFSGDIHVWVCSVTLCLYHPYSKLCVLPGKIPAGS